MADADKPDHKFFEDKWYNKKVEIPLWVFLAIVIIVIALSLI